MPPATRAQVNVTDTVLVAATSGRGAAARRKVVVENNHTASIFLQSGAPATVAGGYEVKTNAISPEITLDRGEDLHAIAVAQTAVGAVNVLVIDDVE